MCDTNTCRTPAGFSHAPTCALIRPLHFGDEKCKQACRELVFPQREKGGAKNCAAYSRIIELGSFLSLYVQILSLNSWRIFSAVPCWKRGALLHVCQQLLVGCYHGSSRVSFCSVPLVVCCPAFDETFRNFAGKLNADKLDMTVNHMGRAKLNHTHTHQKRSVDFTNGFLPLQTKEHKKRKALFSRPIYRK